MQTGILTFGPYESSDPPVVTVVGEDANCDMTFVLNSICNDVCTGATPLNVGDTVSGDTTNATDIETIRQMIYGILSLAMIWNKDITVSLCGTPMILLRRF